MFLVKLNDRLTRFLMILAAGWAFVLCFVILSDIIGKNVFNTPVYGVREVVMNSIVMIVFLQASYAIRSGSMLRADFIIMRFSPLVRRIAAATGYLLGAGIFLVIVTGGIDMAVHSWVAGEYEGEGALRVPSWPTRFMILFGGSLACLNYLLMAILEVFRPEAVEALTDDTTGLTS
ncbi:MAG: TRAP transporter small permease [Rhodospirillaceae bacterium]|jgi:TRAP-type C4-dicarboxylate transport system permease small subunit